MSSITVKIPPATSERVQSRSLIKPHLRNLSGSATALNGIIVERNLECPHAEFCGSTVKTPKHVVVFPSAETAKLESLVHGRRREFRFSRGDAIINPAGLFTAPRWDTEIEIVLVGIDPHFMNRAAEQCGSPPRVDLTPRLRFRDPLLEQLATALVQEFERKDLPPDHLYAESLASAFVAHLLKKYSAAGARELAARGGLPAQRLRRVIEYIHDNLGAKVTIEAMAELAGLSASHFIALFRQSTGLSPHRYVAARRLEQAIALLKQTSLPIADVALRAGFADQSHLTRTVRSHLNTTPGALRAG